MFAEEVIVEIAPAVVEPAVVVVVEPGQSKDRDQSNLQHHLRPHQHHHHNHHQHHHLYDSKSKQCIAMAKQGQLLADGESSAEFDLKVELYLSENLNSRIKINMEALLCT